MSTKRLTKHNGHVTGHCLYRVIPDPYFLTLQTDGHGTISANALTATPSAGCAP